MASGSTLHQLNLDNVSPATRLLEKRRQMFEVQEALETQKEEFARKEEMFKRREDGLRLKDLQLQEALIRFNKFLQENDSKRGRAEKKAQDEIKTRHLKEAEIEALQQQLNELTARKEIMKRQLDKNECYHKYLDLVIDSSDDFQEINDLLKRHKTLMNTKSDNMKLAEEREQKTEHTRLELQTKIKEKETMKLKKHNDIATLQQRLEQKTLGANKQAMLMEKRLEESADKKLELGRVQMAIENIYERCHVMAKMKLPVKDTLKDQLKVIGDYMMDMRDITSNYSKSLAQQQKKK